MGKLRNRLAEYDTLWLFTACNWAEVRGEGLRGMCAQAVSVMNRVKRPRWWGKTLREVLLKPYQYSCFNEDDPNLTKMLDQPWEANWSVYVVWAECHVVTRLAANDLLRDITDGATHYHRAGMDPPPEWASSPKMKRTVQIENYVFYREE